MLTQFWNSVTGNNNEQGQSNQPNTPTNPPPPAEVKGPCPKDPAAPKCCCNKPR